MVRVETHDRQQFLSECGYRNARLVKVAQDAGPRVYYSIAGDTRQVLFVDAGASADGTDDFIRIGGWLRSIGLSAPNVYECDSTKRFLLVEDFGRTRLTDILGTATGDEALSVAVDLLSAFENFVPPVELPVWGLPEMIDESIAEFFGWWWPATFGDAEQKGEAAAELRRALHDMAEALCYVAPCFVHKDYFANNLMWLPRRDGRQRIGILDFQNGSRGIPGHDLLSLLEDVRNPKPITLQRSLFQQYVRARPSLREQDITARYETTAILRHIRVAGVWARICARGHTERFARFGPPTWEFLGRALTLPSAAVVQRWFDRWVPETLRHHPQTLVA